MSLSFNLSLCDESVKVQEIKRLRPFKDISQSKIHKITPYEEFWLTDFEIDHINSLNKSKK
jgi:tRNA(Ile)-lysidine synthase TilS/MesJ